MNFCPSCGHQSENAKFCGQCGTKMLPQPADGAEIVDPVGQGSGHETVHSEAQGLQAQSSGRRVVRTYVESEPVQDEPEPEPEQYREPARFENAAAREERAESRPVPVAPKPDHLQRPPLKPALSTERGLVVNDENDRFAVRRVSPAIYVVLAIFASAIVLIPSALELVMSFSRMNNGNLSKLQPVGFMYYRRVLESPVLIRALGGSLLLKLLEAVPGLLVGALTVAIVKRVAPRAAHRLIIACVALIPTFSYGMFPLPFGPFMLNTIVMTFGMTVFAGLMCEDDGASNRRPLLGVKAVALLWIAGGLFTESYNGTFLLREWFGGYYVNTFSSWIEDVAIANMDFGFASAISVCKNLVNVLVAAFPIIVLSRMRGDLTGVGTDSRRLWSSADLTRLIIAAALFVANIVLVICFGTPYVLSVYVLPYYIPVLLLAALLAYALIVSVGSGRRWLFVAVLFLFLSLTEHMPSYIAVDANTGHIINNISYVFLSLSSPRFITIAVLLGLFGAGRADFRRTALMAAVAASCFGAEHLSNNMVASGIHCVMAGLLCYTAFRQNDGREVRVA